MNTKETDALYGVNGHSESRKWRLQLFRVIIFHNRENIGCIYFCSASCTLHNVVTFYTHFSYLPTSRARFAHLGDTQLCQTMSASSKIPTNTTSRCPEISAYIEFQFEKLYNIVFVDLGNNLVGTGSSSVYLRDILTVLPIESLIWELKLF